MGGKSQKHNAEGFTLIEIAVVLIIIGLMVAAVLSGKSLLAAAQANQQIIQIQQLEAQVHAFRDKYGCLPGDCMNATAFLGATSSAGYTIANGNGDGLIGVTGYTASDCQSAAVAGEPLQFFLQLNAAGMAGYTSDGATPTAGKGFPLSSINNGTGLLVTCLAGSNAPLDTGFSSGNVEVFGSGPGCGTRLTYVVGLGNWGQPGYCEYPIGIPAATAQAIDSKIDDGLPNHGNIGVVASEGIYPNTLGTSCLLSSNKAYPLTATPASCAFSMGKRLGE